MHSRHDDVLKHVRPLVDGLRNVYPCILDRYDGWLKHIGPECIIDMTTGQNMFLLHTKVYDGVVKYVLIRRFYQILPSFKMVNTYQ